MKIKKFVDMQKLFLTLIFLITAIFLPSILIAQQNVGIGTNIPTDQLHTTGTVRFQNYSGTGNRIVQLDPEGKMVVAGLAPVTNSNIVPIVDGDCGAAVFRSIIVNGLPTSIASSKIAVQVNITHTYVGDLHLFLYAPGATQILHLANRSGLSGDNMVNTIFMDAAATSFNTVTLANAPFTDSYKPAGNTATICNVTPNITTFSAFGTAGAINPNGTWYLSVADAAGGDVGTINSWSISFTGIEGVNTASQNNYIPKFLNGGLINSNITQTPTGNIGVGILQPTQKLEVAGAIKIGTTATNSKGTIRYNEADSSLQVYDNTRWKSMVNNFDVVGYSSFGGDGPFYFTSMTRNADVPIPALFYTVKQSGYYLVIVDASGDGVREENDIYNFNDNRRDVEGSLRLGIKYACCPGFNSFLERKFFTTAITPAVVPPSITSFPADGDKSVIKYFNAGDQIQPVCRVAQDIGATAPAQQPGNTWYIDLQIKYILLN